MDSTSLLINPLAVFQVRGESCPVLPAVFVGTVNNNQTVVAAVSGKRIRVMGWAGQSSSATVGSFIFKSASGGTALTPTFALPAQTAGVIDRQPLVSSGYLETNTGEGLFADVATAAVNILLQYIVYTP